MKFIANAAKVIVLGSALYHLLMGTACLLSRRQASSLMRFFYRIEFPENWDPLAEYSVKPLGAFAIFTSIACAATYFHPGAGRPWIESGLAVLFLMRASFRYLYRELFLKVMKVPWSRSRWNVAFNFLLAMILGFAAASEF